MKCNTLTFVVVVGILLFGSLGLLGAGRTPLLLPGDSDNDGVPDEIDQCPAEDASFFDRNGDGCIDDAASARHIEFWAKGDLPFTYYINADGAPGIGNGSDFTAIQSGMSAWSGIQGVTFSVTYGGTTAEENSDALDGVNLVTFKDSEYQFGTYTIAVGISTSYTVPTSHNNKSYRPGQIVDADLIFNSAMKFKTPTAGNTGTDIQSVVTHEAGHLFGISHTPVKTSTMFFVLPPGTDASSLESDDELMFFKAYGDSMTVANASRISGTVTHGKANTPVAGAIVFAIDAASGDTATADYTLPNGSYAFPGLPDGDYYIAIHQIDTSAAIGYLMPRYVNALVETTAVMRFPPEYYDQAESNTDNPENKTAVAITAGLKVTGINLITNIDVTPPEIVETTPLENASSVKIDAAIKITFSEQIDDASISKNFSLVNEATQTSIYGKGILLHDDSVLAFTPSVPFDFATQYSLTLKTGLTDKYDNGLAQEYTTSFTTELMPPVAISSLAPNKGVIGTVVVINGVGFDRIETNNTVMFGSLQAEVVNAYPNRLIVLVPQTATTSDVTVEVGENTSNAINFTILSATEIARGFQSGIAELNARPRSITVLPEGGYAYVATDAGVAVVVVDPGIAGYLDVTPITVSGGLDATDAAPDGKMVYGVSGTNEKIYAIDSDPSHGPLFNTVLAELPTGAEPLGITIDPSGGRAFVPTADGEIQIWDVRKGSETFNSQIGAIIPPDASVRGKMAVDPAGDYLLSLSGAGKLYVFDLGPDTLYATATVLSDPKDVVVDPTGQHAFVSDGTGNVSIVPLSGLFKKSYDINTGGSLLGMTVTPAGMYLYACNRQLELLDVIDINENGANPRSLVATIPLGSNPIDIDLSPDGFYAFSVVDRDQQLIVSTIGLGPELKSLSRRAGPPGTKLVLAGNGFGAPPQETRVVFSNIFGGPPVEVTPSYNSGTSLTVMVPDSAGSGPVKIIVNDPDPSVPQQVSNSLYFQVLSFLTPPGRLRLAARAYAGIGVLPVLEFSPTGDFLVVGGETSGPRGIMGVFDTDPESIVFNQWIKTVAVSNRALSDIAITPDGERAYLLPDTAGSPILCHNVNYHSGTFGKRVGEIDLSSRGVTRFLRLGISPDGEILLASGLNAGNDSLYAIDIVPGSTNENRVIKAIGGDGGKVIDVRDIAFHPAGRFAYIGIHGLAGNASIDVLCLDQTTPNFLWFVASVPLYMGDVTLIHSIAFEPDGGRCLVLMSGPFVKAYDIAVIDASNPAIPVFGTSIHLPVLNFPGQGAVLNVSPRGDRAIAAVSGEDNAYYSVDLTSHADTVVDAVYYNSLLTKVDMDFTPDGSRLYVAGPYQDSLFIYDFNAANRLYMRSGNEQSGIIGQPLAAPLRVWVAMSDILTVPVPGVPVTFEVTTGGGCFTDSYLTKQVVATGQDGYAEIDWTLGSVVGVQTQRVAVTAEGLVGSPMQFIADSYDDPTNLPLDLAQMLPLGGAINVSATTAVQGVFSRAVDPASISETTFYINKTSDASLVSAITGYSDKYRRVSLMPVQALDYSTQYSIVTTAGISATDDGPLRNPGSLEFFTAARPPLLLTSVTPPSGTAASTLVLAGKGFDPVVANDKVLFNDTEAVPFDAGVDFMKVKVPSDAITGAVRVVCGSDTSNALPFVMLVPNYSPIDEVLTTIGTGGASAKSVAITPDGALAYSVSPDGDVVIPIDVNGQTAYSSISVGDNPVAIDIHPDNTYGYVANFGAGTVSVICINPDSVRFNKVVETIKVGTSPIDIAVRPDGNRIYVANLGSSDVSVVDGDEDSEAHHQVLTTVGTGGAASKSVAITPDGTKVYVGTETGYIVIDSQSNAVLTTIGTGGASTKSVSITPDGGMLILVTTEGMVVIYDIAPGSSTPNSVLTTIGTGGAAVKSVCITPDGATLYIILENSDKAIAYSLTVIGSAGAIAPGTPVPPSAVVLTPIDTIPTGRDPACIVFDPSGSGLALICNAGDNTITFLNASNVPAGQIKADIVVTPRTLNLRSNGRWVTGSIELPTGYWPEEIDLGSVLLQSAIHAELGKVGFEDSDQDGLRELVLKFDRAAFQAILPQGEYVPVAIAGTARNRSFSGADTIRTIRPVVKHPTGCALAMGEITTITWTSPAGYKVDSVSVHWTHAGTVDWFVIAHGISDNHSLPWQVPNALYDKCRVMVSLYDKGLVIGMGMSQDEFMIGLPIAVTVGSFSGSLGEGAAVLAWSTMLEQNIDGFNLLRGESEEGLYERINPRVIPSEGSTSGGAYEFRDSMITLNRSYFYKLEEVSGEHSKVIFGPYEVVCRAPFELAQNVPNPFNPTTSIRFTIPEDGHVMLAVYDAAGQRIRTLVDKPLKANFYRVDWNGRNDAGRQVSSGMYFYRIHAGRHTQARKMLLLR
jgi:YVTN family beta-propeller protein